MDRAEMSSGRWADEWASHVGQAARQARRLSRGAASRSTGRSIDTVAIGHSFPDLASLSRYREPPGRAHG